MQAVAVAGRRVAFPTLSYDKVLSCAAGHGEARDIAQLALKWWERDPKAADAHLVDTLKLVQSAATGDQKPFVDFCVGLIGDCHFPSTRVEVARHALEGIAKGPLDVPRMASLVEPMVNEASSGKQHRTWYDDGDSARSAGLSFLKQQAKTDDQHRWLELQQDGDANLHSVQGMRALENMVLHRLAQGTPADPNTVLRGVQEVLNSVPELKLQDGGSYSDKAGLVLVAIEVARRANADADMKAALDVWEVSLHDNNYPQTIDNCSRVALQSLLAGHTSSRERCGLAAALVNAAVDAGYTEFDRPAMGERLRTMLPKSAPDLAPQLGLVERCMEGVRFRDSRIDMPMAGWNEIAQGAASDFCGLARIGHALLSAAESGMATIGEYVDDKAQVLTHLVDALDGVAHTEPTQLVMHVWKTLLANTPKEAWPVVSDAVLQNMSRSNTPEAAAATFKALAALPVKLPDGQLPKQVLKAVVTWQAWPHPTTVTFKMIDSLLDKIPPESGRLVLGVLLSRMALDGLNQPLDPWKMVDELWHTCGSLDVRNAVVSVGIPTLSKAGYANPQRAEKLSHSVVEDHEHGSVEDDDNGVSIGDVKLGHPTVAIKRTIL